MLDVETSGTGARNVRVMIVDDTDHVRVMLSEMMKLDGFNVVSMAASANEALTAIDNTEPDIIVMDYKMPEMDGLEATRRIRARNLSLPVVLYTAYLDASIELEAKEAGVTACIGKVEGLAMLEREISALCLEFVDR